MIYDEAPPTVRDSGICYGAFSQRCYPRTGNGGLSWCLCSNQTWLVGLSTLVCATGGSLPYWRNLRASLTGNKKKEKRGAQSPQQGLTTMTAVFFAPMPYINLVFRLSFYLYRWTAHTCIKYKVFFGLIVVDNDVMKIISIIIVIIGIMREIFIFTCTLDFEFDRYCNMVFYVFV